MMNNQNLIDYYLQGNSLAATSRKFNISTYKLKKFFQEQKVHIRNRSEQCALENQKRGYKLNHDYFDELNETKAYWLGFIAADGTVRKNKNEIKIGLKASDIDILKQLKNDLESEAPIKFYITNNGYEVVEFKFSSAKIKSKLAFYSIVPNKTYLGITMKNIPDNLKLAFIKGFFDGDGSFSSKKVKIVSHTNGILQEIADFIPQKTYLYYFKNRDIYSLEMSTLPSLDFLKTIYQLETPCLDRKYQSYKNIIYP